MLSKNVTSYWLGETLGNDSLIDTYFLIVLAFLCGAVEVSVILEWDAASLGDWCPTFRNSMVVSYSKVEMEMRLPSCLETLVTNHLFMQHHIPEGRIPQARNFFFATTFRPA